MDGYGVPVAELLHTVCGCVGHTIWEPDTKHRAAYTAALAGPGLTAEGQWPGLWLLSLGTSSASHSVGRVHDSFWDDPLPGGWRWEVSGQVGQPLSGCQLVPTSPFTPTCLPRACSWAPKTTAFLGLRVHTM